MEFNLIVLVISYLFLITLIYKTITSFLNGKKIATESTFVLIIMVAFCSFFTNHYVKSSNLHKNLDAIFAYDFGNCSPSVNISSEKISSPFTVEACGNTYTVTVNKGIVQEVKPQNENTAK